MISFRKTFLQLGFFAALVCILPAEEIHVAFFCDKNRFCEYIGVAAYSIGKNMAADDELVIHILMLDPMEDSHRTKFQQLKDEFGGRMDIRIYNDAPTIAQIRSLIGRIDHRPNTIGYYIALTFDKILPAEITKVICLDSDIMVQASLRDFWNILPQRPYCIAAARDYYDDDPEKLNMHAQNDYVASLQEFTDNPETLFSLYINAGVMLLDLEHIRKRGFFSKAITEARNDPRKISSLYIQTLINIVFRGRILECRGKWNTICFPQVNNPNIAIMHFAGPRKPWAHPHQIVDHRWWQPKRWPILWKYTTLQPPTLWHQYRQESPWKHSKWAMLAELFGTHKDRKIFIPFFGMILGIAALPFLGLFYVFLRRRRRRHG